MTELTVTAKGQVTLRKDVLRHLGVAPGDKVDVAVLPGGRVELRAARPARPITDLFGLLHRPDGPHLSIEEIGRLAAEGWARRR